MISMTRGMTVSLWVTALAAVACVATEQSLTLVRDGKPSASIVTAAKPTPAVNLAAVELQYLLERITGARLPIVTEDQPTAGTRILLGDSVHTRRLGIDADGFGYMDTLIKFTPDTLVLYGRDEAPNATMPTIDYNGARGLKGGQRKLLIPGDLDYQGSLRATYRFLEDYCGLHVMGPFETNLVFEYRQTLTVTGDADRHRSAIATKQGSLSYGPYVAHWGGRYNEDNRRLFSRRMRWGGKPWYVNHTFVHMKYKQRFTPPVKPGDVEAPDYRKKLREYEAAAAVFERELPEVSNPKRANQFCFSSRTMIEQVAQDARDFFDGKLGNKGDQTIKELEGRADVFPVVPLDCGGYCQCDACKPLLDAGKGRDAHSFNCGRYSDYVFHFVNAVAREVAKTHPDKYVGTLAYEQYYWMPTSVKLEKNVVVAPCMHPMYWDRQPACRKNEEGWYKKWLAASKAGDVGPLYMWNYDFAVTYPTYYAVSRGRFVKQWLTDGVQGVFHCGGPEPVGMYVTNKLYENKNLDPEALVDQYFRLYFGPAAHPMREFYDELVDLTSNPANYPLSERGAYVHVSLAEPNFVYTDARVAQLRRLIEDAKKSGSEEPYATRIASWETAVVDRFERDVYAYHGKSAIERDPAPGANKKLAKGFISTVTAYPADHWYASRKPKALVDASDMVEGGTMATGSKVAAFAPSGHGFHWPKYYSAQGAWIMFDLGGVHKLEQMHLWNYNDAAGNTQWGMKDVEIGYAADLDQVRRNAWTMLPPRQLPKAQSPPATGADGIVDFGSKRIRYVMLAAHGPLTTINWQPDSEVLQDRNVAKVGLGKARFYGEPVQAGVPVLRFVHHHSGLAVKLAVPGVPDALIHYTIDGAAPDKSSPRYAEPFTIGGDVVVRARAYLPGMQPSDYRPVQIDYSAACQRMLEPLEVARGKPVSASGSEAPQRDVRFINDGKTGKHSAWWAANAPHWCQIDLGSILPLSQLWLQPWWDEPDGRVATYTVDVSTDGRNWRQIIDWSANTQPSRAAGDLHRFPPTTARYLRLNNLRWLCEIKVYRTPENQAPADLATPKETLP